MPLDTAQLQNCFECSNCSKIWMAWLTFTVPSSPWVGV